MFVLLHTSQSNVTFAFFFSSSIHSYNYHFYFCIIHFNFLHKCPNMKQIQQKGVVGLTVQWITVTFTFLTFTFTFYKTSYYEGSNGLDWIDWQVLLLAPPFYHSLSLSTQMSQYKTYPAELCGCLSGLLPLFKFLSFTLNKMS